MHYQIYKTVFFWKKPSKSIVTVAEADAVTHNKNELARRPNKCVEN